MNGVRHTRKLNQMNQQRCNSTTASSGSSSSKSATATTTVAAKRVTSSIVVDSLRHESPNTAAIGPSHRNLRSITRAASSASSNPDSPGLSTPVYVPSESPTLVTGSRKRKQLSSRRSTQTPSTIDPSLICDGGHGAEDGPSGKRSRRMGDSESSETNNELSLLAHAANTSSATANRSLIGSVGGTVGQRFGQPSAGSEVLEVNHKKAGKREQHRIQQTQHHGHQTMLNHYNSHSVTSSSNVIEPDSSISSVESVRDRSHLTLDFKEMKPRSNSINHSNAMAINPLLLAVAAAAAAAHGQGDGSGAASSSSGHSSVSSAMTTPTATLTNAVTPIVADSTVSPLSLPKELLESIVLSPDKFLNLPTSFLAAAVAQHQSHLQKQGASQLSVPLETPTPTRLLNPKNVTKAQETFAEGFLHALQKVQSENRFAPPTQVAASSAVHSPSAVKFILSLLTPTISTPSTNFFQAKELTAESESVSSTTTSAAKDLLTVDTALGGVGGSKAGSASAKSSPSSRAIEAEGLLLAELLKLDPNNSKGYMDLFPHYQNQRHSQQGSSISPAHYQPQQGAPTSSTGHYSHSPPELAHGHGHGMGQPAYGQHSPGMGFQPPPMMGRSASQMGMAAAGMAGADMMGGSYPGSSRSLSNGREFDPQEQERRKLERKRARNRQAATKCRQRKLEKITELEGVVADEQARGHAKQLEIETLRQSVRELSAELQRHRNAGCNLGGGHGGRAYK